MAPGRPRRPARHPSVATLSPLTAHSIALLTLLTLAACTPTLNECRIRSLGQLPTHGEMPVVPVLVQNRSATLLVDTGTPASVLNTSVVEAAGMKTHPSDIGLAGVGGPGSSTVATVPALTIGYATAHDVAFFAARLSMQGPDGKPLDGLFGADFLANYDLLIDLPAHHVGLYETAGCTASSFAPLGAGVPNMPFGAPGWSGTRIAFPAELDGVTMPFILDSGAAYSFVTVPWAVRTGLRAKDMVNDPGGPLTGLGSSRRGFRLHRFNSFRLPIEIPVSPILGVYSGPFNILGDDFLRRNRVWISYPLRRLYVQPVAQ